MSKIKKVLFVLLVFSLSLTIVVLNFRFLYMAGGDQSLFLNPEALWDRAIFAWDPDSMNLMGWLNPSFPVVMPLFLFFKLFSFLPGIIVEYLYFSAVFTAIFFISFHFFYNYLFSKDKVISIVCSLVYFFNAFFFASFLNYNIHLAFVLLPLLFILAHEIINHDLKKIILYVILTSLIIPSIFINPPALIPLIFVFFSYLSFLAVRGGFNQKLFIHLGFVGVLFFLLNIWWVYSFLYALFNNRILDTLSASSSGFFRTTSLHDALRFLGGWSFGLYPTEYRSFRYEHLYLTNIIFIICNYIIVILAYSAIFIKKNKQILYFLALSLFGLFLIKGDLRPLGELYMFMFKNVPGMYIFREPFTKFMLIQVFTVSILLGYFLMGIKKNRNFKLVCAIIILAIFIPSVPFLIGGFTPNKHLGPMRSYLVKIPQYLYDYKNHVNAKKLEYRVLSEPMDSNVYLWESGFNINTTALKVFGNKSVLNHSDVIVNYFSPESDLLCSSSYAAMERRNANINNYFSLMNVGQIAQENSKDWRFKDVTSSPSQMSSIFDFYQKKGLITKEAAFGQFNLQYLSSVNLGVSSNDEAKKTDMKIDKSRAIEVTKQELLNRSGIDLYSVSRNDFTPRMYAPQNVIVSKEPASELPNILSSGSLKPGSSIFFLERNLEKMGIVADWYQKKEVQLQKPVLEFKKINPAKYRIRVHGAKETFPLIFSENYHDDWKAYLKKYPIISSSGKVNGYQITKENKSDQATPSELGEYINNNWVTGVGSSNTDFVSKNFQGTIQNDNLPDGNFWETWMSRNDGKSKIKNWFISDKSLLEIPDKNHLVANGYANSWIINPSELCGLADNKSANGFGCQKNKDGTYDMELVVEFSPQRFYYIGPAISLATLAICLGFVFAGLLDFRINLKR